MLCWIILSVFIGIPYLNKKDEHIMRTNIEDARERRKSLGENNSSSVECPPEHKETVKKAINAIVNFLSKPNGSTELTLPPANGFVRKLIYQEVWKNYTTNDLQIETKNGIMVVKCFSNENEKSEAEKKRFEGEEEEVAEAVGFSKIIMLISQSISDKRHDNIRIRYHISPVPQLKISKKPKEGAILLSSSVNRRVWHNTRHYRVRRPSVVF